MPNLFTKPPLLSQVAQHSPEGRPICPACGGMSFKPRHSHRTGYLVPKREVQCVTCGAWYRRG